MADNHAHLTATDIRGEDITLQGGKLTLDGQQLKQTQGHTDDRWFYSWQYDVTRETRAAAAGGQHRRRRRQRHTSSVPGKT